MVIDSERGARDAVAIGQTKISGRNRYVYMGSWTREYGSINSSSSASDFLFLVPDHICFSFILLDWRSISGKRRSSKDRARRVRSFLKPIKKEYT